MIYTVSQKRDTILLSISLLNIDRFSQFFHRRTQLELYNKIINKDPTSPLTYLLTTRPHRSTLDLMGQDLTRSVRT